jgi:hypothetical protein
MEKEKWIDTVLNSTNGMTPMEPDDAIFFKIQLRIQNENRISKPWIWVAAASFLVLFSLNIKLIYSKSDHSKSKTELLASDLSKTNQLY